MKKNHQIILILIIIVAFILRFYKLGLNPPGLYWDEAAFGYDSYSILKTARDQHGRFLPLFFESFGDWKLPLYFYTLVPAVKIFGLNEFSVRFPSAFFGSLTVLAFFFLAKKITENISLSLISSFFLAISPWHIQFSRGGFESTVGLFLVVSGIYFFLRGLEVQKTRLLTFAFLLLTLSMYAYHAYRIFTPLLSIALIFIFYSQIKKNLKTLVVPLIIGLLLVIPLLFFTLSKEGKSRAISQSAFSKDNFETQRIEYDQKSKKPLRFISKYWYFPPYVSYQALNNYIEHFSPTFLFFRGDQIGRHSQVDMGQIYTFDAIMLLLAIFVYKNLPNKAKKVMLIWLVLSPVSAIIVSPTPHAYRTLQMVIPLAFFSGIGVNYVFSEKQKLPVKLIIALLIFYYFSTYLHLLFIHYPKKFAADWQSGNRQMVEQVQKYQDQFKKVYVTNINQTPYIYLLFYQKYDPNLFIKEKGTKDSFDKYVFIDDEVNVYDKGRILYVAPSWKKVDGKWLAAANDSAGRHIYSLWEIDERN